MSDIFIEPYSRRKVSARVVTEKILKYIRDDFMKNARKYSAEDHARVSDVIDQMTRKLSSK